MNHHKTNACSWLILGLVLSGCSDVRQEIRDYGTASMESQLRAAGFKIMIADTKERQDMLTTLSPEHLTRIPRPDNVYYIYADPDVCQCLYVGREVEFRQFQQLKADSAKSQQATITHEIQENQQAGWSPSGPWGNWGWWGITNPNSMGRPAWDPE